MKKLIGILSLALCSVCWAEVRTIVEVTPDMWNADSVEILDATKIENEVPIPPGSVFIASASPEERTWPLLVFDSPDITSKNYAIQGEVYHINVEDEGYLETWNHFEGEGNGPYFTRTMAEFGPMRWIANTSMGFRDFSLPFQISKDQDLRPTKIEMNLVLPSTGRVYLRNVRLVEYIGESPNATPGEWWSPVTSGKIGGILGLLGGLLGAAIGFCGPLVAKGKAKGATFGLLILMAVSGLILLMFGSIAFFGGQPYHVYYPLALTGLLELILGLVFIFLLKRRYAQVEMHRMKAMDVS